MTFESLFDDGPSAELLVKAVCYTVFYAAMAWLPLRGIAVVVYRMREGADQRRLAAVRHRPRPVAEDVVFEVDFD